MIQKPMLAATLELADLKKLRYPLLATPKLDGIRCLIKERRACSRKLKLIPNTYIRTYLEDIALDGFDGEIIIRGKKFNEISSAVMSEDGEPDFEYVVFDYLEDSEKKSYRERMFQLSLMSIPSFYKIKKLLPEVVNNESELLALEARYLNEGYEGIMLRSPNGPYKFGRSTLREGYLIKFKRFTDGEAVIIDLYEKMHNTNEAVEDALGHTKRSSHLVGQVPAGTLGGFTVRDLKSNEEFNIGTGDGLTDELRAAVWYNRAAYIGKIVKYKSQKVGEKDKPRFPTFTGFRDECDM